MISKLSKWSKSSKPQLNILAADAKLLNQLHLKNLLQIYNSNHKLFCVNNFSEVFLFFYTEIEIDLIIFDVDAVENLPDLALIKIVAPQISLISWSDYQHPELEELLFSLGVECSLSKNSKQGVILQAINSILRNRFLMADN